jgi:anti-anti-sigma factor
VTLKVRLFNQGDHGLRLSLAGELDLATAGKAERALHEAESREPSLLIVDLRRLDFMDSSGLHLLLKAMRRARDRERRLILVRGPRAI